MFIIVFYLIVFYNLLLIGVNTWFGGFASPYFSVAEETVVPPVTKEPAPASKSAPSSSSLNDLLMSALDLDEQGSTDITSKLSSKLIVDNHNGSGRLPLSMEDTFVQLNSLSVVAQSVDALIYAYEDAAESLLFSQSNKYSSSNILLNEIQQCRNKYSDLLSCEMQRFASYMFDFVINEVLERCYASALVSFTISGEDMDRRSEEKLLLKAVKKCLHIVLFQEYNEESGKKQRF